MSIFQLRLKNCIQTILELEPRMREDDKNNFDKEFTSLKTYLSHIEEMDLEEEDVARLENVTSDFLAEIKLSDCWNNVLPRYLQ